MKNSVKSLLIFLLFAGSTHIGYASQNAILNVLEAQRLAWNKGDLDGFMQGYWRSDELIFIGSSGIKKGWQTTLDNYKKSYPDSAAMGTLFFDVVEVEVNGDAAFVLGKWKVATENSESSGFFTLYWKKIDGHWKIVIDHSS